MIICLSLFHLVSLSVFQWLYAFSSFCYSIKRVGVWPEKKMVFIPFHSSLHWSWLEAWNCRVFGFCEGVVKSTWWIIVNPIFLLGAIMRLCRLRVCLVYQTKVCEYESDLGSNEHYLSSSENKAWKNIQASVIWVHWYRKGHGFKSCTGLDFCWASFPLPLK